MLSVEGEDRGTVYYWYLIESGFDGSHFGKAFGSFTELLANLKDYNPQWVSKIETGDVEGVRRWIDSGGDVNATAENEFTPLDYALSDKQREIARLLRTKGGRRGELHSGRSVLGCALIVLLNPVVLFPVLVILAPIVLASRWGSETIAGFLGKLAVCAAVGFFAWIVTAILGQILLARFFEPKDRDEPGSRKEAEG